MTQITDNKKLDITSWRYKKSQQIPIYNNQKKLELVEETLKKYRPLVVVNEIEQLLEDITQVQRGQGYILQAGECAERFADNNYAFVKNFYYFFKQLIKILSRDGNENFVHIGRIAGQFAKPRTNLYENKDNKRILAYRGDIINDIAEDIIKRQPDPSRQIKAYYQAEYILKLLNYFVNKEKNKQNFYVSHEALLLNYEEALTRVDVNGNYYNSSAHMVWIGNRTRQLDHAHVEFCKNIVNPIGIKCDDKITAEELLKLLDILNPNNKDGKIILITRFGYDKIETVLPNLIKAVQSFGNNVTWICDPMHGNNVVYNNYKTRKFEHILSETASFFEIHKRMASHPGGIHLEITEKMVSECLGGYKHQITEDQLSERYLTNCDPRLNRQQSLELATFVADKIANNK
ncbi:3-deoxy-7-phosphoheptulonate synthase [Bartonella sp. DGB1]|uniref:3-deoxy-7-phosphoheptulonate synthase n=1 Tax=Bartonella sp. DGB1 TaxID=3239807 RepID=UPI0035268BF0